MTQFIVQTMSLSSTSPPSSTGILLPATQRLPASRARRCATTLPPGVSSVFVADCTGCAITHPLRTTTLLPPLLCEAVERFAKLATVVAARCPRLQRLLHPLGSRKRRSGSVPKQVRVRMAEVRANQGASGQRRGSYVAYLDQLGALPGGSSRKSGRPSSAFSGPPGL